MFKLKSSFGPEKEIQACTDTDFEIDAEFEKLSTMLDKSQVQHKHVSPRVIITTKPTQKYVF